MSVIGDTLKRITYASLAHEQRMQKVIRNDNIGMLLFLAHTEDATPSWPDAPGFIACADALVQTSDFLERPKILGTLRLYLRNFPPNAAPMLNEIAEDLTGQLHWLGVLDVDEVSRIRIEPARTRWIEAERPPALTPEQESNLLKQTQLEWDDFYDESGSEPQ